MVGYHVTNRGTYKCDYCNHKSYKGHAGVTNHLESKHPVELAAARKIADANRRAEEAERRARIAERGKDELSRQLAEATNKPKDVERYSAVRYCPNCLSVDSVNVPKGVAVGVSGCFRCGMTGGGAVEHVNVNRGDYTIGGW